MQRMGTADLPGLAELLPSVATLLCPSAEPALLLRGPAGKHKKSKAVNLKTDLLLRLNVRID